MAKVKDDVAERKPSKPPKGKSNGGAGGAVSRFFANAVSTKPYKPKQGWNTRLYTGIGLGLILAFGVWRLHEMLIESSLAVRLGVPAVTAAVLGWLIYRIVQYPPFAEFLIATEAEMNKVSWTSKEDLYRSSIVVLATVAVLAVYLFVVDWFWLLLLRTIGVLQFSGAGGFGSTS